jgi:integrator complex subunit 3
VRLLQDVSKIPEFEQLWKDLLSKPTSFLPNFAGVSQLLQMRTPRIYLQCRISPDMENHLMFLMKNVSIFLYI